MEKIQHDIAQLEKESKETNEWKTKMDALLMTFKKGFEGFEKVVEGINNNHTALNETIAMLTIKMKNHITSADSFKAQVVKHQVASKTELEAFKAQVVKHQVASKTEFEAFGKKLTKSQQQLDATNRKFAEEMEKNRRIKDELKTKMDAIGERTTSTDVRLQELQTEFQAIKAKVDEIHNSAQSSTNPATMNKGTPVQFVPEWVLRERKRNNIIIFGQQETDDDLAMIKLLAGDLDLDLAPSTDIVHHFRIGTSNSSNLRPLVVKFVCSEKKRAMLLMAKKLRGMEKWNGVIITHDMTKLECQVEKAWEIKLRQDAEHLNNSLTADEKSVKFFKVIGGRRERRIACFPIK